MSVISPTDCAIIREKRRTGLPYRPLAERFGVSLATLRYHALGQCTHTSAEPVELEKPPSASLHDVLVAVTDADEHVLTTEEVNDRLPHDYAHLKSVRDKLLELADERLVEYKRVGRGYVWWSELGSANGLTATASLRGGS